MAPRVLTGTVLDQSGTPLPGATVQAFGGQAPEPTDPGTVTDANGTFSFYIGERDKIRARYVGMQPYEITLDPAQDVLNIQLFPDATLPVVTITDTRPQTDKHYNWVKYLAWLIFIAIAVAAYYSIK